MLFLPVLGYRWGMNYSCHETRNQLATEPTEAQILDFWQLGIYFGIGCECPGSIGINLCEPFACEFGSRRFGKLSPGRLKPFSEICRVQLQRYRGYMELFTEDVEAYVWLDSGGSENNWRSYERFSLVCLVNVVCTYKMRSSASLKAVEPSWRLSLMLKLKNRRIMEGYWWEWLDLKSGGYRLSTESVERMGYPKWWVEEGWRWVNRAWSSVGVNSVSDELISKMSLRGWKIIWSGEKEAGQSMTGRSIGDMEVQWRCRRLSS